MKIDPPQKCWTRRSIRFHHGTSTTLDSPACGPGDRLGPQDSGGDVAERVASVPHVRSVGTLRSSIAGFGSPRRTRRKHAGKPHNESREEAPRRAHKLDSVPEPVRASLRSKLGTRRGRHPAKDRRLLRIYLPPKISIAKKTVVVGLSMRPVQKPPFSGDQRQISRGSSRRRNTRGKIRTSAPAHAPARMGVSDMSASSTRPG